VPLLGICNYLQDLCKLQQKYALSPNCWEYLDMETIIKGKTEEDRRGKQAEGARGSPDNTVIINKVKDVERCKGSNAHPYMVRAPERG